MMKRTILLSLAALCCALTAAAQDLIVKTDAAKIEAKVIEITPEAVRYKRFSNPDGPTYVLPVAQIHYIQYANGEKEYYTKTIPATPLTPATPTVPATPATPAVPEAPAVQPVSGGRYVLKQYEIGELYDQNGIRGVICQLSDDRQHGLVVSLDEIYLHSKKRVPVVAGTGSNCTKTAVELSKEAQAAGVDGCLVVTPYYNKATQKGLIEHYTAVARSIDLPIIMYNVPSRTGCNIQPETAVKLAREVDNIVAIKAATGNLSQESKTMMLAEGCLDMYSGEDGLIVPLMSIGAKGVISVLSNVAPKQTHDICAEFFAGNIEKSRQLQFEALELVDALFSEVNPIPVKTALNLMGMEVGPLRMPLCEMEEANLNKLKTALKNYGLIK